MAGTEVTRSQHIKAPPEVVGAAIASPHGLSTWLCDEAQSEKHPGGRLLFRWHDGRQSIGRWTEFDVAKQLAWTWRSDQDDDTTAVRFTLNGLDGGTNVTVTHSGVPAGSEVTLEQLWSDALTDLGLFIASGQNGRMLRRPMLGIMFEVVSPETAEAKGLGVDHGILVSDTTPDNGAAKAGIQAEDLLVSIGGHPLTDWASIADALDRHRAGDVVDVVLWRGTEQLTIPVELNSREQPDLPTTIDGVIELARQSTTRMVDGISEVLDGVGDEAASFRPSDEEWSIKQVLAHLCVVERFSQDSFCRSAADDAPAGWTMDAFELRQASMVSASIDALREWTIGDLRSSEDLALFILSQGPSAYVVHDLASSFHWGPEHVDDHIKQMRTVLEAYAETT